MKKSKVSIITVSFNSAKTILNTIKSVNSQTYNEIEHIFIDGLSSDNTVEIIKKESKRNKKVIIEKDKGIYDAMNKGINNSTGDIIGFLNSDDIFFSNQSIELIMSNFKPEIDCIHANLIYKNKKNKVVRRYISQNFKPGLFEKSWTPAHPTFYCRKNCYVTYGNFDLDYNIASDGDLMLRFLQVHKIKSLFLNKILVVMNEGGISTRGIKSTFIISKEIRNSHIKNKVKFSLSKYVFFKLLKAFRQKFFRF